MITLVIGIGGIGLGFLLILLISAFSPKAEEMAAIDHPGVQDQPHSWLARLSAEDLGKLLGELFSELKFDVEDQRISGDVVDLFAVNPTPITGGRMYIRGVAHPPLGIVQEDEVRSALETARAEMAGKALVATGGVFSAEAKSVAKGAPIELVDGETLMGLIKKHLPPIAVAKRI